jgi:hypothetical protein
MDEHLAAELSVRLAAVEASTAARAAHAQVAALRLRAENGAPGGLGAVVTAAFALTDELCLAAITEGEPAVFVTTATVAHDLFEFCLSAQLVAGH